MLEGSTLIIFIVLKVILCWSWLFPKDDKDSDS